MKTDLTRIKRFSRIVLALFVGTLIWGAAIDNENFSVDFKLPLDIVIADGYILLDSSTDSVLVTLTGSGLSLLTYQTNPSLTEIEKNVQITGGQNFPAGVSLGLRVSDVNPHGSVVTSEVTPYHVSLSIDTLVSRRLPVSVISSDGIPSRFRFVSVEPEYITVTGPSSVVFLMDSVITESVTVTSGLTTASLAFTSDLVAYSEGCVQIRINEPVVPAGGSGPQ